MPVDRSQVVPNAKNVEQPGPCGEAQPARAYGCCFCVTGKEQLVADRIHQLFPGIRTIVARQEKHRSVKGQKMKVEAIILPSYVFFEAPVDAEPVAEFPREYLIRILEMDRGVWQLRGEDERIVRWLFEYDGLLGFSKAYREGEQIRIVSGPLKDLEGRIVRIDKRGRSGQVILEFNGKAVPVWLGFELLASKTE